MKKNNTNYYLIAPKWELDWYWGFGYIQSFSKGDLKEHLHFKSFNLLEIIDLIRNNYGNKCYLICEYLNIFYILQKQSELSFLGSSNIAVVPEEIKDGFINYELYKHINTKLMIYLFNSLYDLFKKINIYDK